MVAAATWMHGSAYLWALPMLAFACARQWRGLGRLSAVTLAGIVAGASLTGHPIEFLWQGIAHGLRSVGGDAPSYLLVGEFQPSSGSLPFLVSASLVLVAVGWGRSAAEWKRDPLLWMAALGWTFGLGSQRFWFDWGMPAAMVTLALAIEQWLVERRPLSRPGTLAATVLLAVGFTLTASADHNRRWSNEMWRLYAPLYAPQNRSWLPGRGGVLYNTDMNIFYLGIYLNPRLDYRFQVGFEPTLLPDRELKLLREIQRRGVTDDVLRPWVARLRPIDRIAVLRNGPPPAYTTLEWFAPMPGVWLGRIPNRSNTPVPDSVAAPPAHQ
jgi:hypothetical protein